MKNLEDELRSKIEKSQYFGHAKRVGRVFEQRPMRDEAAIELGG